MSLPRTRLVDLKNAQAVIKVRAEAAFEHCRLHIDVRRGDDADIDRSGRLTAQPFYLAFLKKTQQACLTFERQIADFIEKECAAIGCFDAPDLALVRARERAALVAE